MGGHDYNKSRKYMIMIFLENDLRKILRLKPVEIYTLQFN